MGRGGLVHAGLHALILSCLHTAVGGTSTDPPAFAVDVASLVSAAGRTWLVIGFDAAASPNAGCDFAGWQLEWREWGSTGSWTADAVCSAASRSASSCNVTGLSSETGYDFRLSETCIDSTYDSEYVYTTYPIWTRLGARFRLGTSDIMSVEVDTGAPADGPCYIVKECCSDQFSVCTDNTTVASVSRLDVAGGWGQEIELWCPQHTLAHLALTVDEESELPQIQAAGAPATLELRDAGQISVVAYFQGAGKDVGTCGCAGLEMQLCAFAELAGCLNGTASWLNVTDTDCLNPASGSCTITDLEGTSVQPDSVYWARSRIICDDTALDGNYTYSNSAITFPACDFSTHSGLEDSFECQDSTTCGILSWNDDLNVTDDACCSDHGGVKRCSRSAPTMCSGPFDCAYRTDHCCRVDCIHNSGPRECKVPAKAPTILSVTSTSPGVLLITWEAGDYLIATETDCDFHLWYVEVAKEYPWGLGDWIGISSCFHTDRSITVCEATGLDTNSHYAVQVREHCFDGDLDSSAVYYDPVMTLPVISELPVVPDCSDITYFSFVVDWGLPDNLNDCTLTGWELEAQLQARPERYTDEGYFEEAADGWDDYELIATLGATELQYTMSDLQSNREYRLRVRTLCEVEDSQSDWSTRFSPCTTEKAPAQAPKIVEALDITLYTFLVNWTAGDPLGCLFFRWEVQLMKGNSSDWPVDYDINFQCENQIRVANDPCTPDFECFVTDREKTNCSMDVGLDRTDSGNAYRVRVREACTEFDLYSPWREINASDVPVTLSAVPGIGPTDIELTSTSPTHEIDLVSVDVTWTAGTANDCEFDYWLVEFSPSSETGDDKTWTQATQCADVTRAEQACTVDADGALDSDTIYDIRIQEVCLDTSAMASATEVAEAIHTNPWAARIPKNLQVEAASAFSLRLDFDTGKARDCDFFSWIVEWIEQGTTDTYTFSCTGSRTAYCVVTDLPTSYTFYSVRLRENCTDARANSLWTNFSDYVQTWPDPAEPPTVAITNLEAYTLTFAITPGDPLDCEWATWRVSMRLAADAKTNNPLNGGWYRLTECDTQLLARTDTTCIVTGLESFTDYDIRVREKCTNYIFDSDWTYVDAYTTLPIAAGGPTSFAVVADSVKAFFFDVSWTAGDVGQCVFDGWSLQSRVLGNITWANQTCNEDRGTGSTVTCRVDYLQMGVAYEVRIKETCTDPYADSEWTVLGSSVTTLVPSVPPEAPSQLLVSAETAYTFTVTFVPGAENDCYFSGWDVQVRENGTTNETLPDNATSVWVSREECKDLDYAPRDSGGGTASCVVPRLRSETNYDVRVRETCYHPYITWLDSPFNEDEADREAITTDTTAGLSPSGITASDIGPYYFTVQWTAGTPNDCVFAYWAVELVATGGSTWTNGDYVEATECRTVEREVASCNITNIPGLDPGHLASNTEYGVRVQEVCDTYLSVYDPDGKERATYLQAAKAYMAASDYPQTLVPIAAEAPTAVTVISSSELGFALQWTPSEPNECRFSAWEVSYKQTAKCVAGYGYVRCNAVSDADWVLGCQLTDRSTTSCTVYVTDTYSFYDVEVVEVCSDATANSPAGSTAAFVYAARAEAPLNLTAESAGPFALDLEWELADPGECVFMYWDVQVRPRRVGSVENRWYGEIIDLNDTDLSDWSASVAECFNAQDRDEANCTVPDLVSNAIYDVRIAERCNDSRADSDWTYLYEVSTIAAWALAPTLEFVGNETQETFYFEWSPNDPRDCLFRQWYVAVRPSVAEQWIEVQECAWDTREEINNCTVVGLQTHTLYDLLVEEQCIHSSADGSDLIVRDAATTLDGYRVAVGVHTDSNILTVSNPDGYDTCAIEENCCVDSFAVCYYPSRQEFDIIRMDLPNAGWGQPLQISCIKSSFPASERKLLPALPPENVRQVARAANSTTIAWNAAGNSLYISDCVCTTWTLEMRLKNEETEWYPVEECTGLSANVSECLANSVNSNWLRPDSLYEVRLQQACDHDWLNSDYAIIEVITLPGCDFSQHSGRDAQYQCSNDFFVGEKEQDGAACTVLEYGGIKRCPRDRPFMCQSPLVCVGPDYCCLATPCGDYAGGDRVCVVRPYAPENIVGSSSTTDSMHVTWSEKNFLDMDFYPCEFKEWRVEVARYWPSGFTEEYVPQAECDNLPRTTTSCTLEDLVHNGDYMIRVMELCWDDDFNGDFGYSTTVYSVLPIRADTPSDFQVDDARYYALDLSWIAGDGQDCEFDHWEVTYTPADGASMIAIVSDREVMEVQLTGLTHGTEYAIELKERCTETDAESIASTLVASTERLWIQADTPMNLEIAEVTPYSMYLTWEPGVSGNDCIFAYWEITLQASGSGINLSVPLCRDLQREESACNITEAFDCKANYYYAGYIDSPCVDGVDCPITDVDSLLDCQMLCSRNQSCRAMNYRAASRSCYLRDTSEPLVPEDAIHETTACARTVGLFSQTRYRVWLYEQCEDDGPNSNVTEVIDGTMTAGAPATSPTLLTAEVTGLQAFKTTFTPGPRRDCVFVRDGWPCLQISYPDGDTVDCIFAGWGFEYRVNNSEFWEPVTSVTCSDDSRKPDYCHVFGIESGASQEVRMREECTDPDFDSPFQLDYLWLFTDDPIEALAPQSINASAVRIGDDVTNCASVTLNPNGCPDMQTNASIELVWDIGVLNNCSVSYWLLEIRVSGSVEWYAIDECRTATEWAAAVGLSEGLAYCLAVEDEDNPLAIDTLYDVRVRASCSDPNADSGYLTRLEAVQTLGEVARAGEPTGFSVSNVTGAVLTVSFEPGATNDCQSQGWLVSFCQISSSADPASTSLHECTAAWSASSCARVDGTQACALSGVEENRTYQVTVQELCADTELDSVPAALIVSTSLEQDIQAPSDCPFLLELCNRSQTSECSSSSSTSCASYWQLIEVASTTTSSATDTDVYVPTDAVNEAQTCNGSLAVETGVTSLEDCQTLCTGATGCNFIQYLYDLEECHLHQDCSAPRSCTSSCGRTLERVTLAVYESYTHVYVASGYDNSNTTCDGTSTSWGVEGQMSTLTLDACKTACTDATDCNYVQFELDDSSSDGSGNCHLYQDCLVTRSCGSSCGRTLLKQVFTGGPVLCGWDAVSEACVADHSLSTGLCSQTAEEVGAACEVTTVVLTGLLAVNYVSRRLLEEPSCLTDALRENVRSALATLAQVDPEAVSVQEAKGSTETECLLRYTMAIATVATEDDNAQAQVEAAIVLARLSNSSSGAGKNSLSHGVTEFLRLSHHENITVEEAGKPAVDVRNDNLLRVCGAPPAILWMDDMWSPDECAEFTRSSGPCQVPCLQGYRSEGFFRCTASGSWDGSPRCIPEWTPEPWSECSSGCGEGMQQRSVTCPVPGACGEEVALYSTSQACFGTQDCTWLLGSWSPCSTTCGIGNQSRTVDCSSSRSSSDCPGMRPIALEHCEDYSGCGWRVGEWQQCTSSCGNGTQARDVSCISWIGGHCEGDVPAAVQPCHNSSLCQWQIADWSTCSNDCGSGMQMRDVWCSSGLDADCGDAKPVSSRHCRGTTSCMWLVGDWSPCSETCGEGLQQRSVMCASGREDDCSVHTKPSHEQACHSRSACNWTIGAWSSCSTQCGHGFRERSVQCPTGAEDDCSGVPPLTQEECTSMADCSWHVTPWSACSVSCGLGRRLRTVTCPSGNETQCLLQAGEKPASMQTCQNRAACEWQVFGWSACSATCGTGVATRVVACSSGEDADCSAQDRPTSRVNCEDNSGCGWNVSNWSTCSSSCGEGEQARTAACRDGFVCLGAGPALRQPCYNSSRCLWARGEWDTCSTNCGAGIRTREVTCPTNVSSDCGAARPESVEACYATDNCEWAIAPWGACTGTCGSGTRARSVSCPSGNRRDCPATMPSIIESCENLDDCTWQASEWSECSVSCGTGEQSRAVFCASADEAHCLLDNKPRSVRTCHSTVACLWQVGSWSTCNTLCGRGTRTRSVTCEGSGGNSDCHGEAPVAEEDCRDVSACSWNATPWSPCSRRCGEGSSSRKVLCSSGFDADCAHLARPVDQQRCSGDGNCSWTVGPWSSCTGRCGPQTRDVACDSGLDADCYAIVPPAKAQVCPADSCADGVHGVLQCSLRVELFIDTHVDDALDEVQVAIQTVVATMLRIPASAVTVLADKTRRLSSKLGSLQLAVWRRLATGVAAGFSVEVRGASQGAVSFLQTPAGQEELTRGLSTTLAAEGVFVQSLSLSAVEVTEETASPLENRTSVPTTFEPLGLYDNDDATDSRSDWAVISIVALFSLLAVAVTVFYLRQRMRWRRSTKVAAVPIESSEDEECKAHSLGSKRAGMEKLKFWSKPRTVAPIPLDEPQAEDPWAPKATHIASGLRHLVSSQPRFSKVSQEAYEAEQQGPDRPPSPSPRSGSVSEEPQMTEDVPWSEPAPAKSVLQVSPSGCFASQRSDGTWQDSKQSASCQQSLDGPRAAANLETCQTDKHSTLQRPALELS